MKKKFYVFLDIDGVLYDWNYIKSLGPEHWGGVIVDFDPKSIEALNYLIAQLKKEYDVELVISSTWRSNMERTMQILINHGLKTEDLFISRTRNSTNPRYRGREIMDYLENKRDKENYVIIDDETLIIGSMNFTKQGENVNDENSLIIKSSVLTPAYKAHFLDLWKSIKE